MSLQNVTDYLQKVYCDSMALDLLTVENEAEIRWLCDRYERLQTEEVLSAEEQRLLAKEMIKSQNFDHFLATKFSNVKRYGGEGAEGMMGFFIEALLKAGNHGFSDVFIGMAHRGRLNLLTGLLEFPPVAMFRKMKGLPEFPPEQEGAGDVLSHLTSSVDLTCLDGSRVHVSMLPNPSHLEAVNPVTAGKVRGAHMSRKKGDYSANDAAESDLVGKNILSLVVHGDAAIAGQGVNQEIITMANLPHYTVGGTVHFTIDNQVGFTTPSERGRSSRYSSDLARIVNAPVIHVNGDRPEQVVKAARLAMEYKAKFMKDVFVEMHCVRKWGHNELDDPSFTNPALYSMVDARGRSVPDAYVDELTAAGVWSPDDTNQLLLEHNKALSRDHAAIESYQPKRQNLRRQWQTMVQPGNTVTTWDTGLPDNLLRYIGAKSVSYPDDLKVHPHLQKTHVGARLKKLEAGEGLDWGICEALAIGSLLYQGFNVRISGQDVGRATFAHRHAMLVDQETNEMYIPFNDMEGADGRLEICNSPLSEEAVLGFEYGLSVDSPNNLAIWEAQFGDFFNGAQIMLDTFVSSGESKWGLQSALTILLPHGLDGAGPEHSSCRVERFLQMTDSKEDGVDGDNVNWHVVNPTTSAQYFHLLRRQMIRNFRKPLVVVAPKILLRMSAASSKLSDISPGTHFRPVLSSSSDASEEVTKLVFVSGKHYYALAKAAEENKVKDTAFIRLEQLCPFPTKELQDEIKKYPNARNFVWSQEEHRNAGAWSFVQPRLKNMVGVSNLKYVGRVELCQPAVGVASVHKKEEAKIIKDTFAM